MLPISEQGKHCSDWLRGGGHSVYINGNRIIASSVAFNCHRGEREGRQLRRPPVSTAPSWTPATRPGGQRPGLWPCVWGLEGGSPVDSG